MTPRWAGCRTLLVLFAPLAVAGGPGLMLNDDGSLAINGSPAYFADSVPLARDARCVADAGSWPCGEAAHDIINRRLARADVSCRATDSSADPPRVVCSAPGEADIARWMIESGWALAPPGDGAARGLAAEARARGAGRGIWRGGFQPPAAWRVVDRGLGECGACTARHRSFEETRRGMKSVSGEQQ